MTYRAPIDVADQSCSHRRKVDGELCFAWIAPWLADQSCFHRRKVDGELCSCRFRDSNGTKTALADQSKLLVIGFASTISIPSEAFNGFCASLPRELSMWLRPVVLTLLLALTLSASAGSQSVDSDSQIGSSEQNLQSRFEQDIYPLLSHPEKGCVDCHNVDGTSNPELRERFSVSPADELIT